MGIFDTLFPRAYSYTGEELAEFERQSNLLVESERQKKHAYREMAKADRPFEFPGQDEKY